jgi:hypothetical protein
MAHDLADPLLDDDLPVPGSQRDPGSSSGGAGGEPPTAFLPIEAGSDTLAGYGDIDLGTTSGYGEISSVERNPQTGFARVVARNSSGSRFPWGEERNEESITHESFDGRPDSTSVRGEYRTTVKLEDRTLRWESRVLIRSDRTNFYFNAVRRLWRDGVLIREKAWDQVIPRDHQ